MKYLLVLFIAVLVILSCKKDKVGYEPTPYVLDIPSHFPDMIIPEDNPMTVEGVELGRKLFYEKLLSGDNSMSCAECHSPQNAFSDPNQYSTGIDGIQGNRNSMALINLGWSTAFFWDGRSQTLEEQILEPVTNPIEMHDTWPNAVSKLSQSVEYRNMFFMAYGEVGIDSIKVAKSIAQFLRTMISGKSKFDVIYKFKNGLPLSSEEQQVFQTVTQDELDGYVIFNDNALGQGDCFHCHNGPLMQLNKFSNNALDATFTDLGRGEVTGNPNDNGKFKVPTLRNLAYTAPYMHDGRFATLDEVIDHYSFGMQMSSTADPLLEHINEGGNQIAPAERYKLIQFLLTMSDPSFINNPDFQEPE